MLSQGTEDKEREHNLDGFGQVLLEMGKYEDALKSFDKGLNAPGLVILDCLISRK